MTAPQLVYRELLEHNPDALVVLTTRYSLLRPCAATFTCHAVLRHAMLCHAMLCCDLMCCARHLTVSGPPLHHNVPLHAFTTGILTPGT